MNKKWLNLIKNDKKSNLILFSILILAIVIKSVFPAASIALTYTFVILFYIKIIINSVQICNTIIKQVIWLIIAPIFISILPLVILEIFFSKMIFNDRFFVPVYLFFFTVSWVIAVFVFELKKVKVAVQITNGVILTLLSLTFVFYYTTDTLSNMLSSELIIKVKKANLGVETFFDLLIKTITIPYVLSGIWASVAIAYREYKN